MAKAQWDMSYGMQEDIRIMPSLLRELHEK
jgi:hypothetical protein